MSNMRSDDTSDPKGWTFLCWGLGVIVAVFTLFYGAYRYVLHKRVERKFASLAAQGYPTTVEDLRRMYPYPDDGPNAADLYLEAGEKRVSPPYEDEDAVPVVGSAKLPAPDEQWTKKMKSAVEGYLDKNRESLELLHRAADVKIARYPLDLSAGQKMMLPHLSEIRNNARLLSLDAVFHASHGSPRRALKSVRAGVKLGESLRNEPLLISQFVRFACHMITLNGFGFVLNRDTVSKHQLEDWEKLLQKTEMHLSLKGGLKGEIVTNGKMFFAQPPSKMLRWLPKRPQV